MTQKTVPDSASEDPPAAAGGQRSILLLVVLFVIAFVLATAIQIQTHHDQAAHDIVEQQADEAALIAERVDAHLSRAVGATAGAAEFARTTSADPDTLAAIAARAEGVRAAAVVSATGDLLAITDRNEASRALAAFRASNGAAVWTGAPAIAPAAATIVRRVGDRAIIAVLRPQTLLPDLGPDARVLIATPSGVMLYASPALQRVGVSTLSQLHAAAASNGALIRDGAGAYWAAASAVSATGGFRVVAAVPAPSDAELWFGALARFAIVAAAPLAAIGVLYLLTRQNAQRAKLAEAEAQRAEAHYRLAADGARAGVLEYRADIDQVQLSEQAARLLGSERDTIGLKDLLELIIVEDRFTVEEEFRRARSSGLLDARFRVTRGQGLAWIEAHGAAIRERGGPARLFGTIVDATQRHEAEARVGRLERQLRAAVESFSGPFALWDSRRRLLLWNQAFARLFELGPELLRPRASYEAIAAASSARIRREKHDERDPDVRIVELTTGDWLHIVERRAADGGIVTVGVDITPLKRKEEELARNERRLQEALTRAESQEYRIKALAREAHEERQRAEDASRAKSAFLANMSHELRTPLNAVIGFSEIMAKELFGAIGNDQYKQYASDIFDSGNHLLDLINDILDMAKIEAGKLTLAPRPLDPAVAIDQAVRLTKRRAEEKGLSIVVDAEELPEIEADHRAVKQMLLNLLSNAVKFTDHGAIMVHARANAAGLTLRVVDTGCGISPEHLPRLARPFEQVETELARNNSGTGLGLALTKSLAEMHGGKLNIQSEVGKGTIVTITLPRVFGGLRPAEATAAE